MRLWLALTICILSINAAALVKPAWQPGFDAINAELETNLQNPTRTNPFYHAYPAAKYPGVYLWDSAFIALVWEHRNPKIAKDIIYSVLINQQADGRIPHVVSVVGASEWTQPPVLSYAAAHIASATRDAQFAATVYTRLKSAQRWLWKNRRLPNGLFFWAHAYESGIDNSPRFGRRDESWFRDTTTLAAIDLSSYAVLDAQSLRTLAQLALTITPPNSSRAQFLRRDIDVYNAQIRTVTQLIQTKLWDPETGYFFDLETKTGRLEKIRTIASFFPLIAGVATFDQFKAMRAHLVNRSEFNTPIPLPSVARDSLSFEKDCWRGPVWINTAYLVIKGIDRYNDHLLAQSFSRRLLDGVYGTWQNTGKFVEYYDPDRYDFLELTRKKGTGPFGLSASPNPLKVIEHLVTKQFFLGTKPVDHFVGWTGLANVLAVEEF